jgi:predicted nucleic acid-binding Zn ribbon protein
MPAVIFKGSGFYSTDNRGSEPSSNGGSSSTSSDNGKTSTKSDNGKPATKTADAGSTGSASKTEASVD